MPLSTAAVSNIAATLTPAFIEFLEDRYFDEISELLATASCEFVDEELGNIDGDLAADIQVGLLERTAIVEA